MMVYYISMAQPKEPPVSIRPGQERLARIDAYAKEHALSRHLAIMVLIDDALRRSVEPKAAPARKLPNGGGYIAPTGASPSKPPTGGSSVQLGPAVSSPGSRLKKR